MRDKGERGDDIYVCVHYIPHINVDHVFHVDVLEGNLNSCLDT